MDDLSKAASLAFWLITEKHKPKNVACIIAINKYKLPPFSSREPLRKKLKELMTPESLFQGGL